MELQKTKTKIKMKDKEFIVDHNKSRDHTPNPISNKPGGVHLQIFIKNKESGDVGYHNCYSG